MLTQDQIKEEFEKKFAGTHTVKSWHMEECECEPFDNEERKTCEQKILAHLSAQYEKLIEEVIGEDKPVVAGTDGWRTQKIINDEHSRIRTSLQERGINIK